MSQENYFINFNSFSSGGSTLPAAFSAAACDGDIPVIALLSAPPTPGIFPKILALPLLTTLPKVCCFTAAGVKWSLTSVCV